MWNPSRDAFDAKGLVIGRTTLWESLKNPDVWLAATSQIFFTISLCWCCITTYASYIRKRDDIAQLYVIHPDEEFDNDMGLKGLVAKANILFCTHPDTPERIKLLEQF